MDGQANRLGIAAAVRSRFHRNTGAILTTTASKSRHRPPLIDHHIDVECLL